MLVRPLVRPIVSSIVRALTSTRRGGSPAPSGPTWDASALWDGNTYWS